MTTDPAVLCVRKRIRKLTSRKNKICQILERDSVKYEDYSVLADELVLILAELRILPLFLRVPSNQWESFAQGATRKGVEIIPNLKGTAHTMLLEQMRVYDDIIHGKFHNKSEAGSGSG